MGYSVAQTMGWDQSKSLVTISLAVDFIGSAQIGQWLAIETEVIKTGSTICFAQSSDQGRRRRDRARQCDVPGACRSRDAGRAYAEMPVGGLGHEIDEGAHLADSSREVG